MENDLETWEMAKIFGKWLKYLGNSLNIWGRFKYLRYGTGMFQMT